ncbi:GldG family protein [bacterium]|nr:GldG family protein [bacterium]
MAGEPPIRNAAQSLRQKRLLISVNILVQVVAALALVAMLNWLAARHYRRFDWTQTRYYALADKTKQVLNSLREPVRVVVFLQPSAESEHLEQIYQDVRNLLKEFQFHGGQQLRIEYVDPQRDLARAQQLVNEYKVDLPNVVIFACGPRHKYVAIDDMVEFDYQPYGQSMRIKAFKGEGAFLAALQTVTEEEPPTVYFLTGHGERDPTSYEKRDGYSTLASYIKRDNIAVEKWNLQEQQALPTNVAALVVAGPRTAYTPAEIDTLRAYLKNHGRLLVMLDPRHGAALEGLLAEWGVGVDDDLVMARGGQLLGTELLLVDALGSEYAPHPITRRLEDINTSFPYARSLRALPVPSVPGVDRPQVTELVKTPAAYWGETDTDSDRASFDPATDRAGPLCLLVAAETARPQGVSVEIGITRLVAVGTASVVDNSTLPTAPGNLDLFLNALNWLLQREQLMAVGPKIPQEFSLAMSVPQARAVYALTLAGLPLLVAVVGVIVWLRRRK